MSNPVFSEKRFAEIAQAGYQGETMTLKGAINKSILLFLTLVAAAFWVWQYMGTAEEAFKLNALAYLVTTAIIGFIIALTLFFKMSWAPYLAPVYAVAQGVFLGLISLFFETIYPGIVFQAVSITLLIFAGMLLAYKTGLLRATPLFKKVMFFAVMGILLFYLINLGATLFFGVESFYYGNGWLSIGISVLIAGIAAFRLIIDFDRMDQLSIAAAPKFMEWYCGFGLLVTLIWLYMEILNLLSKLQSRN